MSIKIKYNVIGWLYEINETQQRYIKFLAIVSYESHKAWQMHYNFLGMYLQCIIEAIRLVSEFTVAGSLRYKNYET